MTFLPLTGRKLFDHGYKNQLVGGKKKNGVNSLSYVQTNLERRVLCTSFVMKRLRTPNARYCPRGMHCGDTVLSVRYTILMRGSHPC
jgi:hypothetical protein